MEELIERVSNLEYQVADLKIGFIFLAVGIFITLTVDIILDHIQRKRIKKDSIKNDDVSNS